jgi:hypothetical protein
VQHDGAHRPRGKAVSPSDNETAVPDPEIVLSLLRRFAWQRSGGVPGRYEVWRDPAGGSNEVIFPVDIKAGDYRELLQRAESNFLHIYGSDASRTLEFLHLQSSAMLDGTRWEKETALDAGLIQWEEGEGLHASVRAALSSAAKASKESRRYFGSVASYIAKQFLAATYMGQTDIGSYAVTAFSPAGSRFFFSKAEESASEKHLVSVTGKTGSDIIDKLIEIADGLRTTLDHYRRTPRTELFDDLVPVGLSYEMANAFAQFSRAGDGGLRVERATGGLREFEFRASESPVLEKVAKHLSDTREPQTMTLIGEVTRLDHVPTLDDYTIRMQVRKRPGLSTVRVRVSAEEYDVALNAHRDDVPLQVSGIVEREGTYNWIYEPSSIAVFRGAKKPDDDGGDDVDEDEDEPKINDDQVELF